jgi:uncharacterized protein YqgV (UPF0045/DUF77 family)
MRAAVEISMYPLTGDYRPPIQAFIDRLNTHSELRVLTNALSTQVWGPLDRVLAILADEIHRAADGPQLVFVMKVLPGLAAPASESAAADEPGGNVPSAEARSATPRIAQTSSTAGPSAAAPSAEAQHAEMPSAELRPASAPRHAQPP